MTVLPYVLIGAGVLIILFGIIYFVAGGLLAGSSEAPAADSVEPAFDESIAATESHERPEIPVQDDTKEHERPAL